MTRRQKGSEISFIKGTYVGLTGWINASRAPKNGYGYVIVKKTSDNEEKCTRVKKSSVRKIPGAPSSYEEAMLLQHPDIQRQLCQLATMLASCDINDDTEIVRLLKVELRTAQSYQAELGHRARWRQIDYDIYGDMEDGII